MLAKKFRLRRDKEFKEVFRQGRASYDQILGVKIIKNCLGFNRFGILVSTKVSKKANKRNLIKRRLRGIIENNLAALASGYDCLIISLPAIREKDSFSELSSSLLGHFRRLRIYAPKKRVL